MKAKIVIIIVVIAVLLGLTFVTSAEAMSNTTPAIPTKAPTTAVAIPMAGVGNVVFVPDAQIARANIHYTWGWVTGTAYLNKSETRLLRGYSYAVIVAAGMCAVFGWESAGLACAVSGAMTAQWQWVASEAVTHGRCVKIKVPTMIAYEYSGGDCR